MLVMIFLASVLISIFKQTNIGNVIVASITDLIANSNFTGLPLIILLFGGVMLCTIFVPSSTVKWSLMSTSIIPLIMQNSMSPAFGQIIYRFAEAGVMNITPLLAYFIVYLAFLEKYNQSEEKIRLGESIKYQLPYTIIISLTLLALLVVWYLIGIPLGINSVPTI